MPVPVTTRRTIVYGAGEAGSAIADLADRDPSTNLEVLGFIDDDATKAGRRVAGRVVFGGLDTLPDAVSTTGAGQLLIAMGSASAETIRSAFAAGRELGLAVRTVPNLRPLRVEDLRPAMIRPVRLEDLLPRRVALPDVDELAAYLRGASVLITGGAGSIGQELARQIIAMRPGRLTILDQHEEGLWAIDRELQLLRSPITAVSLNMRLADIRSSDAVHAVFRAAAPDVVFHAAALKHVPIVEMHPSEGVLTNVIGTRNVLRASETLGIPRFVLISTDKAVDPVGVMGVTKRLAELLTIATAQRTGGAYVAVRFGNVLGSSGSVVPTFLSQIEGREPITITHPEATRYFMTISEAITLILEAGAHAASGAIYILDMGEQIRIVDLARDLIQLAGIDPDDVPLVFTGLRPGERIRETLSYEDEPLEKTPDPGIRQVRHVRSYDAEASAQMSRTVDRLEEAARAQQDEEVRRLLTAAITMATV
jgi:FlaA1/EpsC-like NDP-sugar epimerase